MLHIFTPICNAHTLMLCCERITGSWMREKREGGEERRRVERGEEGERTRRECVVVCGGMEGSCERIWAGVMYDEDADDI